MSREEILAAFGKAIRAYQTSNDNWDQALADLAGLNRTDMRCIDLIDQAGGMTAGELANAAGLTTGAVTAVVDRLERAGYARRVPDPVDRRRVRIEVTPKVWESAEPVFGPYLADSWQLMENYTDEEIARFTQLLRDIMDVQARHTARVRLTRASRSP